MEKTAMPQVIIAKCCVCGKIRTGSIWIDEPENITKKVIHSHTYCPMCLEKVLAELEQNDINFVLQAVSAEEEPRIYAIVE